MTIQILNLGTVPDGAGGDTFRTSGVKLNENFANQTHAASRYVGTDSGNLMQVGAFGIGSSGDLRPLGVIEPNKLFKLGARFGLMDKSQIGAGSGFINALILNAWQDATAIGAQPSILYMDGYFLRSRVATDDSSGWYNIATYLSNLNTVTDGNGFIKKASPIVQLFADKIETNEEAKAQNPVFEKVGVGSYVIKNTEGFSDNGWYIEMPKDANGNVLVAVQYQQFEDKIIEVKTFAKKFDEETGDIIPNIEKPRDIPKDRWIDIRLKELPKPKIEVPISTAPPSFQPTNLSQAVAAAMGNSDGVEQ